MGVVLDNVVLGLSLVMLALGLTFIATPYMLETTVQIGAIADIKGDIGIWIIENNALGAFGGEELQNYDCVDTTCVSNCRALRAFSLIAVVNCFILALLRCARCATDKWQYIMSVAAAACATLGFLVTFAILTEDFADDGSCLQHTFDVGDITLRSSANPAWGWYLLLVTWLLSLATLAVVVVYGYGTQAFAFSAAAIAVSAAAIA